MKPEKFSAEGFEKELCFDVSIYLPQFYTTSLCKEIYYHGMTYQAQ
jgi:hypothetical protein